MVSWSRYADCPEDAGVTQDEIDNAPIVPVNCASCQMRKDQEAELARYRAFVAELKEMVLREWCTSVGVDELLNKHGLGEQE